MAEGSAKDQWFALLRQAVADGSLVKLTLGGPCRADPTLRQVSARPVRLKAGPRLSFVFRQATRDLTKNFPLEEGIARVADLLGTEFRHAHLFTTAHTAELDLGPDRSPTLTCDAPVHTTPGPPGHDRVKARPVDPHHCPWLQALGITIREGAVRRGMEAKFRQINKFIEILDHLLAALPAVPQGRLRLVDMGCGKGYLTFAAYDWLRRTGWPSAEVRGIEARPDLVDFCRQVAAAHGMEGLHFETGSITSTPIEAVDILVALHACDTATDDALAKGIAAGATLMVVTPCCHKELRPQLRPPPVLADALRHGILRERQAEFVTDALRAALLDWAGYTPKVFEFISPEHTAKNLMIAALKRPSPTHHKPQCQSVQALAAFYGIRTQRLAQHLGIELAAAGAGAPPA